MMIMMIMQTNARARGMALAPGKTTVPDGQ
jgi:hypothetical protein